MKGKYRHSVVIEVKRPSHEKYEKFEPFNDHKKVQLRPNQLHTNAKTFNLPKEEILPVSKLKRTNTLLPFKLFMKKQDSIRFKKRIAISIYDKHRINRDNIEKFADFESLEVNTIADIDSYFYKHINGRPITSRDPVFKFLKLLLNDFMRMRQEIGYKKDCILNIDVNKNNEEHICDQSAQRLSSQVNYFDRYISEDYHNSMSLLTKWEQLEHKVDQKVNEVQNLANEMFSIKSRIVSLDYRYSQQQKYGRFLYYLSPPTWRAHNREFARSIEIEAKGFDYDESHDEDTFAIVFQKLSNICYGKPIKPVLYFNHPEDLVEVFDTMENQQLHYFTHVTHLTPYIENLKGSLQCLKVTIVEDSSSVLNLVGMYDRYLEFYEAKCLQLKTKFYRILFGIFYDSVGSEDVLKLKLHLEFCFEKIVLDKPMNMDVVAIFKHLESVYMDYSYRLDSIGSETVRRAVSKYQEIENKKTLRAKRASKELRLFNRLETQLLRAHGIDHSNASDAAFSSQTKVRNSRSLKKGSKNKPDIQKRESLTADELEYLALFTDWTENEDPAKYLQRLSK